MAQIRFVLLKAQLPVLLVDHSDTLNACGLASEGELVGLGAELLVLVSLQLVDHTLAALGTRISSH